MNNCTLPHYFIEENKNILIVNIGISENGYNASFLRYVKKDKKVKTALVPVINLNDKKLFMNRVGKDILFKEPYTFFRDMNGYQCFPLTIDNIEKYINNDYFNNIHKNLENDIKHNFKIILKTLEKYKKEEYFYITGKEYGVENPSENDLKLLEINGYIL